MYLRNIVVVVWLGALQCTTAPVGKPSTTLPLHGNRLPSPRQHLFDEASDQMFKTHVIDFAFERKPAADTVKELRDLKSEKQLGDLFDRMSRRFGQDDVYRELLQRVRQLKEKDPSFYAPDYFYEALKPTNSEAIDKDEDKKKVVEILRDFNELVERKRKETQVVIQEYIKGSRDEEDLEKEFRELSEVKELLVAEWIAESQKKNLDRGPVLGDVKKYMHWILVTNNEKASRENLQEEVLPLLEKLYNTRPVQQNP